MARQGPGPIEANKTAREAAALVADLSESRRDVLMCELEQDKGDKFSPDVSFSATLAQRKDGYWYATCSYGGKSFSAYVGKERDDERAVEVLRSKVRTWLLVCESHERAREDSRTAPKGSKT